MVFTFEFEEKSFCAHLKIVYVLPPSHNTLAPGRPEIYTFLKKVMLAFVALLQKKTKQKKRGSDLKNGRKKNG